MVRLAVGWGWLEYTEVAGRTSTVSRDARRANDRGSERETAKP
jgi:hypothetical protein